MKQHDLATIRLDSSYREYRTTYSETILSCAWGLARYSLADESLLKLYCLDESAILDSEYSIRVTTGLESLSHSWQYLFPIISELFLNRIVGQLQISDANKDELNSCLSLGNELPSELSRLMPFSVHPFPVIS